jgi:lactate dehydrogenase-like 2-hydroxyacid dehydrogenase
MVHTVTLTRRWPAPVEAHLQSLYEVSLNAADRPRSHDELAAALATCDALCPTVTDRIDARLLSTADVRTKIIASFGVGFEHIDLDAARDRGIVVTNTPGVLTDCTADLTMALLLGAARRVGEGEREVRGQAWSGWRPTHMMGTRVTGKTLGIVGLGRIGVAVARRARLGFGMQVLFHNPTPPPSGRISAAGAEPCGSLDELLQRSDFVSLHCPATPDTHHLIDAERIAQMPSHAYLINTARGTIVDPDALVQALRERRIRGAGLDVYEGEPEVPAALLELDSVMLLPHLGSATQETRNAMGMRVAENLAAFFAGNEPPDRLV